MFFFSTFEIQMSQKISISPQHELCNILDSIKILATSTLQYFPSFSNSFLFFLKQLMFQKINSICAGRFSNFCLPKYILTPKDFLKSMFCRNIFNFQRVLNFFINVISIFCLSNILVIFKNPCKIDNATFDSFFKLLATFFCYSVV